MIPYILDREATGRKLKERRMACGYSQETVAQEISAGTNQISWWESGKHTPKLEALVKLMQMYDVDGIDDLIVIKKQNKEDNNHDQG